MARKCGWTHKPKNIKPGDWVRYRHPAYVRDLVHVVEAVGDGWIRTVWGDVVRPADVLEVRRG